jgi:thioredoxin reductase/ferredoxin
MKGDNPKSPVDLLVVGAGPAGTAAAFRATELGMSVMVVDRDCVLSILRNWAEEKKLVDAEYDDCAELPFPTGGELIAQLPFPDQSPAGDLYTKWIGLYDQKQIPYRNGVELGACTRQSNGVLQAECIEAQTQAKSQVYCKSVLLALGSGSATKIRLMGDATGIRYRLGAGKDYVGAPACVVGGGMAAAEAVVAIATAKAEANDSSDVFWCYRGRSMPKVAKGRALASRFYESWTQGNIRYLPFSEPLAVFRDEKGKEFVAIKTRRVEQANFPPELVCYEFEKRQVLACIGAERPVEFLTSLGIQQFSAADAPAKKRLAVTALRESQQAGIYLAGSLLDPAFIETGDFRPEALQSTVKEHPGCFKTAITDGVRAAETIHRRLTRGVSDESIRDELVKKYAAEQTMVVPAKPAGVSQLAERLLDMESAMGAAFVQIGPGENPAKTEHFFTVGESVVGRSSGRVTVASDALLLDTHAAFKVDAEECYVTNTGYGGECYVRFNSERTVQPGTVIVAGRQRLRVDLTDGKVSLARLDAKGNVSKSIPIAREERSIGRDDLDPRDFALSRSHLSISDVGGVARVRDSSRNGTFLELRGSMRLNEGDEVWMGEQRFRFVDMRTGRLPDTGTAVFAKPAVPMSQTATSLRRPAAPAAAPASAPAPAAPAKAPAAPAPTAEPAAPAAAPAGEPVIVLASGTRVPAASDKPMLSFLADANLATDDSGGLSATCQTLWECWDRSDPCDTGGSCGKCVVTIAEGMAQLSDASSKEKNTIKKINKKLGGRLDEAKCRLACQAVVKGPVKIVPSGKTDG